MFKKSLSLLLALTMVLSLGTTAFATEISTSDSKGETPVTLTTEAATFSVTVPSVLPISVDSEGNVVCAESGVAKIVNNGHGTVKVTGLSIAGANGWKTTDYDSTDMTRVKVNTKLFAFTINNEKTTGEDTITFDPINFPKLSAANDTDSDELVINYDAIVAPLNTALNNINIADIVFTIGWNESSSVISSLTGEELDLADNVLDKDDYLIGSGVNLSFQADAPVSSFSELQIDGVTVDSSNYTVTEGSTIVTVNSSYLDTLDNTSHTFTIINSTNGGTEVVDTFDVYESYEVNSSNRAEIGYSNVANLELEIPAKLVKNGENYLVNSLSSEAFMGCSNLKSVKIPRTITVIKDGYLGDSLANSYATFAGCTSLVSVELPETLTKIGLGAFYYCPSLVNVEMPSGLTSIGDYAFHSCNNLALTELPSSVTTIGDWAFYHCYDLALTELPANVTSIGGHAFVATKISLTELPAGLRTIEENTFYGCESLALTKLPEGLENINYGAFWGCKNIAITEIPASVTTIGENVFGYCNKLTSLTFKGTPTSIHMFAFNAATNISSIYVPWSADEIPYAPFGATNAIVYYAD